MEEENRHFITPEIDKRQHRRAKLITQVRCEALGREEVLVTRDISAGGIFISSSKPLPANSKLSLTFRLSPTAPAISCEGAVSYAVPGLGMGVHFSKLSKEARQALEKFVDESS